MSWYSRLRNVFRSESLSEELDDEFKFHLAETVDGLIDEGLSPDEAWRRARLRLGNYSIQKERTRDMDIAGWLDALRADFVYALRQVRFNPGFAAVAILSLALGIGANTAIFQLLDAIRLRGLPVQHPEQLATIQRSGSFFTAGSYNSREEAFTYAQLESLGKHQTGFSDITSFNPTRFNLSTSGRSRYAEGLYVGNNFLHVLGVAPIAGTGIQASDDKVACSATPVVLSYSFWQREYGGSLDALNKTITLDGRRFPIGGITPPAFFGPEPGQRFDVALPLCADNLSAKDGKGRVLDSTGYWLTPIARLKPGWTVARASAQVRDLSPTIFRETLPSDYRPEDAKTYLKNKLKVTAAGAGVSILRTQYEDPLWILMAITGAVLLIACANLANLLLARASAREREMAVRQAVGAWRGRLILQLLSESLLLAVAGTALGLALALALSRALVAFLSTSGGEVVVPLGLDWHAFGFLSASALVTCLLFGLLPAIRASRAMPATAMHGSRTTTASRERNGLRRALVASQVALSLILLVAAILFSTNLRQLMRTSLGFDSHNVLLASITLGGTAQVKPEQRRQLFHEIEARINALAGVVSAAPVMMTPFSGSGWNGHAHADNDPARAGGKEAWFNRVGQHYFATLGTPLVGGRDFNAHDDLSAPNVAIVNQTFVKRFFNGRSPLGRTFHVEGGADRPDDVYQIVGIVGDTKYGNFSEEQRAIAVFPQDQDKDPGDWSFVIRAQGPLGGLETAIQRELAAVNRNLLVDFRVMDVQIRDTLLRERLMANLSVAFGILAACLSCSGLYGVTSYMVARRRNEMGLRIALGASRSRVYALVAKDSCLMVGAGLVIGLTASWFLGKYAESLLYKLKAKDPVTLVLAAGLLVATAAVATLVPARRAAHADPMSALREE
jgi:predicted permease